MEFKKLILSSFEFKLYAACTMKSFYKINAKKSISYFTLGYGFGYKTI